LEIVFVFVNFNNTRFSKSAVESLSRNGQLQHPVYIVDNNSQPAERAALVEVQKANPKLKLTLLSENIGYFPALNIGIKEARQAHPNAKAYVVGNNDLLFPEDFAEQVGRIDGLLNRYPVVSPNIVTMDGVHQNPHVIAKISALREVMYDLYHLNYWLARIIVAVAHWTRFFTDRSDESFHQVPQEINQGYGACYLLSQKFFENFDELWAPSFLMYEEFFLSQQLSQKGFKVFYEPSVGVRHYCHAATGQLPGKLRWNYSKQAHQVYRKYVRPFGK